VELVALDWQRVGRSAERGPRYVFSRSGTALNRRQVVVADLNEKGAQAAVDELKKSGYEAHAIAFNQSDEESIKRLIEGTVEKYGALHVLMNNAADLRHAVAGRDKDTMSVDAKVRLRCCSLQP
jgi:NAD(P)-dependent dehydrogenase (short-subunit alcohol dehydrogenase family)